MSSLEVSIFSGVLLLAQCDSTEIRYTIRVLMRPGVLRRGAAAFASIFSDWTQFVRISLFPRWLLGDRVVRFGRRSQITALSLLAMVLFRFDFTALSGIWEVAPLVATCASTSSVHYKRLPLVFDGRSIGDHHLRGMSNHDYDTV